VGTTETKFSKDESSVNSGLVIKNVVVRYLMCTH
jgi:hypothetical protein